MSNLTNPTFGEAALIALLGIGFVFLVLAFLMVILYGIAFSMNRICASFIVNDIEPRTVNLPAELAGVIALYFILCVGNWSVTCLMEGEGRFRDAFDPADRCGVLEIGDEPIDRHGVVHIYAGHSAGLRVYLQRDRFRPLQSKLLPL